MVCFNVSFPEGDAVNPIQQAAGATVVTRVARYHKWIEADMIKYQLQFYMTPGTSIKTFYRENNLLDTSIPEKTFGTYWRLSGLTQLQDSDTAFEMAKVAIEHYVATVKKMGQSQLFLLAEATATLWSKKKNVLFIFVLL